MPFMPPPQGSKPTATLNNHSLTTNATNGRQTTGAAAQTNGSRRSTQKKSSSRKTSSPQAKVTKLLFAVSCTFLLLSLPSHIVRLRVVMLIMVEQRSMTPNVDQMLQVIITMYI